MLVADIRERDDLAAKLICPACQSSLISSPASDHGGGSWACSNESCEGSNGFISAADLPVLVDHRRSILDPEAARVAAERSILARDVTQTGWRSRLGRFTYGHNKIAPPIARTIIAELEAKPERASVLVVGGGSIGTGAQDLYTSQKVDLIAFDVYWSRNITFIADGHSIPLAEASVDAVWIQAVLEHVVDPVKVASEVERVLKPGGLVFADTPFLWPVHEKAYDFTRWTAGGHRWLFRRFEAVATGTSSGPGVAAILAIRCLAAALLRSWTAADFVAAAFVWLRFLDRFTDPRRAIEGAAGLFFFGRKTTRELPLPELISFYDEQAEWERKARALPT
jgi:SAM-dependent methyltransferase